MLLLRNLVQPYDWGPVDGLARLLGSEPTGGHEAELWVGTHEAAPRPSWPATPPRGPDAGRVRGRPAVPAKVLPSTGRSRSRPLRPRAGRGGLRPGGGGRGPGRAPHRNYRDAGAKPEVLVAIEPTWVLCGFRPAGEAADLLTALGVPSSGRSSTDCAAAVPAASRRLGWLLRPARRAPRRGAGRVGGRPLGRRHLAHRPLAWVARLARQCPGDPTCVAPCCSTARAGTGRCGAPAPGNLHAYLEGRGVSSCPLRTTCCGAGYDVEARRCRRAPARAATRGRGAPAAAAPRRGCAHRLRLRRAVLRARARRPRRRAGGTEDRTQSTALPWAARPSWSASTVGATWATAMRLRTGRAGHRGERPGQPLVGHDGRRPARVTAARLRPSTGRRRCGRRALAALALALALALDDLPLGATAVGLPGHLSPFLNTAMAETLRPGRPSRRVGRRGRTVGGRAAVR